MEGTCKFSDSGCRYFHNPTKKGLNLRRRSFERDVEENLINTNDNNILVQSMAKALDPNSSKERRCWMGSRPESARWLDNQLLLNMLKATGKPVQQQQGLIQPDADTADWQEVNYKNRRRRRSLVWRSMKKKKHKFV